MEGRTDGRKSSKVGESCKEVEGWNKDKERREEIVEREIVREREEREEIEERKGRVEREDIGETGQ